MGQCAGCGASIDRGEVFVRVGTGSAHATCAPRVAAQTVNASPPAGFLFALDDAQLIAPRQADEGRVGSERESDTVRYAGQLARVRDLMSNGAHLSLTEIATATGMLETSASARLRDLRKPQFGAHVVTSRLRPDGEREYQLVLTRAGVVSDEHENAA
jgi:hypothetical protein